MWRIQGADEDTADRTATRTYLDLGWDLAILKIRILLHGTPHAILEDCQKSYCLHEILVARNWARLALECLCEFF